MVIDLDKPSARVYIGPYNFSVEADTSNRENLLLVNDRRIAVSYVVAALRIFDHDHFRVAQLDEKRHARSFNCKCLRKREGEHAWSDEYYTDVRKGVDCQLFA